MNRPDNDSYIARGWATAVAAAGSLAETLISPRVGSQATVVATAAGAATPNTADPAAGDGRPVHGDMSAAAALSAPPVAIARPSFEPYSPELTSPSSQRAPRRDSGSSADRDTEGEGSDLTNRAASSSKSDWRSCNVCGDKAACYNFDVITCESCKAFFRRNAVRTHPLRCNFSSDCAITVNTRRFCSACRLRKCFAVGMKKDLILGEVEKRRRMDITLFKRKLHRSGTPSSHKVAVDSSGCDVGSPGCSVTSDGDSSRACGDTVVRDERLPAAHGDGLATRQGHRLPATMAPHELPVAPDAFRTASAEPSMDLSTASTVAVESSLADLRSPKGAFGPPTTSSLPLFSAPLASAAISVLNGQMQGQQQLVSQVLPRRTYSWATTEAAGPWATASPLRRSDSWPAASSFPSNEIARDEPAKERQLRQLRRQQEQGQEQPRHSFALAADEGFVSCGGSAPTTPGVSSLGCTSPPLGAAVAGIVGMLSSSATAVRRQLSSQDQGEVAALVQHYVDTLGAAETEREENDGSGRPPTRPVDLETALNDTGTVVRRLISFAKGVRGFADMPVDVQMALLKAAAVPCLLLRAARIHDADDATAAAAAPGRCTQQRGGRYKSDPVLSLDAAVADRELAGKAAVLIAAAAQLLAATTDGRRCDVALLASLSAVALLSPEAVAAAQWAAPAADASGEAGTLATGAATVAAAAAQVADAQQRLTALLARYAQASLSYGRSAELTPVLLHMLNSCKQYARLVAERLAAARLDVARVDALLREVYDLRDPVQGDGGGGSWNG